MSELYKLEFELPLKDIQDRIDSLKKNAINSGVDVSSTIKKLEDELVYKRQQIYENLTRWERVQLARHPNRPYSSDYISEITSFWFELHGDKLYADDPAILAGLFEAECSYIPEVIKGIRKSRTGAIGIAQIMPGTAADYNVDPTDPTASIYFAAQYLRDIMDGNRTAYNRQVDLNTAIYMYNAGPNYTNLSTYPVDDENKRYLPKVLKAAGKYGYGKKALIDPGTMRSSIAQQL